MTKLEKQKQLENQSSKRFIKGQKFPNSKIVGHKITVCIFNLWRNSKNNI